MDAHWMRMQVPTFPRGPVMPLPRGGCSVGGRTWRRSPRQHPRHDTIAALPGEAEHVDRRHVHVTRQRLAQQRARPEQACAHRRGRDRQTFSGLFHRHILYLAHDEYRTECCRELIDSALERATDLGAQRGGRGRFATFIGHVGLRWVWFGSASILKGHHNAVALVLAQARERLIDDDACKPRRQPRRAAKFVDVAIGIEVGVLERVLRSASSLRIARATRNSLPL